MSSLDILHANIDYRVNTILSKVFEISNNYKEYENIKTVIIELSYSAHYGFPQDNSLESLEKIKELTYNITDDHSIYEFTTDAVLEIVMFGDTIKEMKDNNEAN